MKSVNCNLQFKQFLNKNRQIYTEMTIHPCHCESRMTHTATGHFSDILYPYSNFHSLSTTIHRGPPGYIPADKNTVHFSLFSRFDSSTAYLLSAASTTTLQLHKFYCMPVEDETLLPGWPTPTDLMAWVGLSEYLGLTEWDRALNSEVLCGNTCSTKITPMSQS